MTDPFAAARVVIEKRQYGGLGDREFAAIADAGWPAALDEIKRLREPTTQSERIDYQVNKKLAGELLAAEQEIRRLREAVEGKWDKYDEHGDAVLPRGWQIVDGGRLDELEAAEAELDALRAANPKEHEWTSPGSLPSRGVSAS